MPLRRMLAALSALLVMTAGLAVTAAPAQAANRFGGFDLIYGQSFLRGAVTFYDRSVHIEGDIRSTGGSCRSLHANTRTAGDVIIDESQLNYAAFCPATSQTVHFAFNLSADLRGGAASVNIGLRGYTPPTGTGYVPLVACKVLPNNQNCQY